jgi:signal transduction histidine kinase
MQIRTRLTLQFLLIGGIIMIVASVAIYLSTARFHRNDFYDLLRSRAISISEMVLDSYEYSADRALRTGTSYAARLQNEKILILSFDNDTIYISDKSWELKKADAVIRRVKSNEEVFYKQESHKVLGTLYASGSYRFVVIAAAVDKDGPSRLKELMILLIVVCLISLMMFSIAGWFYSGRALKPISDVVRKVEDISITSLNLRVPEGNGTDEIGQLARTFNKMLERLESSFALQKNFIANASHELRTPLTSINGQIEVLMMKDRSANEYMSALASVLEDIKSLIDLTNKLLLIARTSAEGFEKSFTGIRIDEILWQVQEEMKKYNKEYNINILMDNTLTDSNQMIVTGDEYLMKVALSNIIDNACKYSPDNSVDIRIKQIDKRIEVAFKDKGIGIPEEDMHKIFEPFYRGTNVLSIQGIGIGLSLVNQIIRNHNGSIKIFSETGKGTTVIVILPSMI